VTYLIIPVPYLQPDQISKSGLKVNNYKLLLQDFNFTILFSFKHRQKRLSVQARRSAKYN